jgi:hypothetical protein
VQFSLHFALLLISSPQSSPPCVRFCRQPWHILLIGESFFSFHVSSSWYQNLFYAPFKISIIGYKCE